MSQSYLTGATFVPGGDDSYYMPEVVSPAPQRIMSELPSNIQDNLAHFEEQTQGRSYGNQPPYLNKESYSTPKYQTSQPPQNLDRTNQTWNAPSNNQRPPPNHPQGRYGSSTTAPLHEAPNFSPFPALRNPPPNVPPTDEQREATLEAAREAVLASNDPETQLIWAQDALAYVEVAQQDEQRISTTQPPRARTPRIEHMLREDGMKVVDFLADQHHPKAEFMRGMWLEFGKFGRRIDKKEAFHCYTRAAEKGYARAEYRIGMQFESSNDALKAIKYYQKGVDAGDSASCYRLGMMTLLGQHGQVQDYERGLNLIYSAATTADENAPQGAYVFGMLKAQQLPQVSIPDKFLPLDTEGARINIEKAAYLGFAKAQLKMGSAYELCELGCKFDPALSLHYNALAARQGEAEAEMAISKWFLCGHEGLFEKNEEMAFTYAQRAAVSGMATAQFAMGYFYEVGIYVPVNFQEAKDWYSRAAASGNKDAGNRVESISRSKTLSRKDHERVAISKIRQRYGSQGPNLNQLAPLPEIEQPSIDMPDPSKLSLTPRPSDHNRPQSTTPYPMDANPPRPGLYGHTSNQSLPERPVSAFGINPNLNPNLRSSSAATVPLSRPDPYSQPGYQSQNRPYPSPNSNSPGYGRGYRPGPGPSLSPSPGPLPPGRGQPRPGSTSPFPNSLGGQPRPPAPPAKVDLGFAAPPDPSGADRIRKPGADEFPRRYQYQQQQQQQQQQRLNPNNQGQRPPVKPLPHQPGQNQPPSSQRPAVSNVQAAKITPSKASNLPAEPISPAKPSKVSASTRPPKKGGPQTFQEMGIPQGKGEGDCVFGPTAADVSSNLHNKVTKTAATKYLKEMHERKEIEGRAAGKQIVYHTLQDAPTKSSEELAEMEAKLDSLREEVTNAKSTEKALKSELFTLSSIASTEELRSTVEELQAQEEALVARLQELKEIEIQPVGEKEKIEAGAEQTMWRKHVIERSTIVKELCYKCLEILPEDTTKEEVWEQLGRETEMP